MSSSLSIIKVKQKNILIDKIQWIRIEMPFYSYYNR
jgi:hypothetical protein